MLSRQYVQGSQVSDKNTKPILFFQTTKAKVVRFSMVFCSLIFAGTRCSERYSEPCQTSRMELYVKIVNDWKSLAILAKVSS